MRHLAFFFSASSCLGAVALAACSPSPVSPVDDASVETDAGLDGGPPDARPPRRDAALVDAGTWSWSEWPACDPSATSQRLTFVHVNDLHAHYGLDAQGISPWARVRHFYERTRLESPYTIFTDGGDDHEKGSVAELLSEGRSTVELTRAMEFDVRVLGNHDFAWSLDELLDHANDPHAIVLSANHHLASGDPSRWHAEEARVLTIGCVRVGFVGLTSTPWDERDRTIDEPFYPELTADYDYAAEAQRVIDAHAGEADVWVMLDHIGQSQDEALAAAVPDVAVVLSGHSHTYTPAPVSSGHAVVIQSGSEAQFVVRLDVDVDLTTHAVTVADYATQVVGVEPPSPRMQAAVAQALATYAPEASRELGRISRSLDGARIADVAAQAALAVHHADAALVDTDTVWTSWQAGRVTQQSFADAFRVERERPGSPGFSSFYRVQVSGAVLAELAAMHGARFRYAGIATPSPSSTYTLVVQKRGAFHPDEQFGDTLSFASPPEPLEEVWETLDTHARARTAACRMLDTDTPLPSCP
ncbi:MAG: metallophosphoesterase [Sandaracinus sp.]